MLHYHGRHRHVRLRLPKCEPEPAEPEHADTPTQPQPLDPQPQPPNPPQPQPPTPPHPKPAPVTPRPPQPPEPKDPNANPDPHDDVYRGGVAPNPDYDPTADRVKTKRNIETWQEDKLAADLEESQKRRKIPDTLPENQRVMWDRTWGMQRSEKGLGKQKVVEDEDGRTLRSEAWLEDAMESSPLNVKALVKDRWIDFMSVLMDEEIERLGGIEGVEMEQELEPESELSCFLRVLH
ncbi:hypothetical protein K469DRAFT_801251 [Zopfia rhizophila CBS 207.26]|uniref:Uncharacterized protein n=1 Tax=Zopfia rhizophila CBS 207.26 TaxID=1314779 RepID=A0A6A6ENF8_9PEZI|nr:hypothetical protein K469DRAFT_801251 [Zopfia rhizophila CBS 207.26]